MFLSINAELWHVIATAIGCMIGGGLIAYFSYKITSKFTIPTLGAVGLCVATLMITRVLSLSGPKALIASIIGAICGWFLSYKFRRFIKASATGLVGSFLLVMGVGCYAPGSPLKIKYAEINKKDISEFTEEDYIHVAYLLSFVILAVGGTYFQLHRKKKNGQVVPYPLAPKKKIHSQDEEANKDDDF